MLKQDGKKGLVRRLVPLLGLVAILLAGAFPLPAQTVEERLAALEGRIRQLESELSVAKRTTAEAGVVGVQATDSPLTGAFIRPAVLTTPGSLELAAVAAPAAPMAPPQQTGDFSGDFEGLNFFRGVKFGGFLDTYYTWDFNEPPTGKVGYRNFDFNHNSLTLSQADFEITKAVSETSPLGYNLQMVFGPTADLVNGGDFSIGNSTAAHFMQYYLSGRLPVGNGLTLDVGKFVTQHGAEVIDTRADWNYSRGLLFAWAIPYYHFGARATLPATDKLTLAAFLVNGWNNVIDNNKAKTGGFQFIWNPTGKVSFIQNYMVGPEQTGEGSPTRHLFDSLLTLKLNDQITFMANYDYGMDRNTEDDLHAHWQGIAGYLKFQPTPAFSLTPRFEYFDDRMGFMTGTAQRLKEFTITPEFVISENLVTRFEFRHDWSNAPSFETEDPDDDPSKQSTASVGMILKF
jgi:hypothetical protein